MRKRLAVITTGAAVLGAMGLTAPAATAETGPASVTPAITCGTHQEVSGTTRSSYFGNCADRAVNIHVRLIFIAPGSDLPTTTYKGDQCVAAQGDYLMGTSSTVLNYGGYAGIEDGTCRPGPP